MPPATTHRRSHSSRTQSTSHERMISLVPTACHVRRQESEDPLRRLCLLEIPYLSCGKSESLEKPTTKAIRVPRRLRTCVQAKRKYPPRRNSTPVHPQSAMRVVK